jgi:inorganic pyrophosphatase
MTPFLVDLDKLGARKGKSGRVNVVVETPAGSRHKFKYDETLGRFRLHKILPRGAMFPFDFGFIPGTRAEDGDPLDLMILGEEPGIQGTVVTVRVIGVIEAQQTENGKTIRNDRLLGLADGEKIRAVARSIKELPDGLLAEIEHFFVAYNRFEGRRFVPLRRGGPNAAAKLIDRAQKSLRDSRRRVG